MRANSVLEGMIMGGMATAIANAVLAGSCVYIDFPHLFLEAIGVGGARFSASGMMSHQVPTLLLSWVVIAALMSLPVEKSDTKRRAHVWILIISTVFASATLFTLSDVWVYLVIER